MPQNNTTLFSEPDSEIDYDSIPKKEKKKTKKGCNGVCKRVAGGFFMLSIFVLTYYAGQLWFANIYLAISWLIFAELMSIGRN
jgi:hypothetical protein